MRALIDTHALIWWLREPKRLSARATRILESSSNVILVSAACGWEISIKENLGKFDWLPFVLDLPRWISEAGFVEQPVTMDQSIRAGLLPLHHRDPFDRLLVAQAQSLHIPIISADPMLDRYDIKRIW